MGPAELKQENKKTESEALRLPLLSFGEGLFSYPQTGEEIKIGEESGKLSRQLNLFHTIRPGVSSFDFLVGSKGNKEFESEVHVVVAEKNSYMAEIKTASDCCGTDVCAAFDAFLGLEKQGYAPFVVFNGGYFLRNKKPSGGLIINGVLQSRINQKALDGWIYVTNELALEICSRTDFCKKFLKNENEDAGVGEQVDVKFAVQVRLLSETENRQVLRYYSTDAEIEKKTGKKRKKDVYTFIGKRANGSVVATVMRGVTTEEGDKLMRERLGCVSVAQLDGGSSARIIEEENGKVFSSDLFVPDSIKGFIKGMFPGKSQNFFVLY